MDRAFATLADLPAELLLNILAEDLEFSTRRASRSLRQVCRGLNEILKHRVAERVRIGTDLAKIEGMVPSPNTFDASCRALHLEGHNYPMSNPLWGILASLVRKMPAITQVSWVVQGHLNEDVLDAICHLSHLEILQLQLLQSQPSFTRYKSTGDTRPGLPKLKTLSVDLTYLTDTSVEPSFDVHDAAVRIICYLVANAPALQHLGIEPSVADTHLIYLADGFTRHWRESSWATISSLAAQCITFPASPTWVSFLSSLSSLEIPNTRDAHQLLWPALLSSDIKLTTIKVERLSLPLSDYLKGYKGLCSFQLVSRYIGGLDTLFSCLRHGLPSHHKTLKDLRLRPACDSEGRDLVLIVLSSILRHNFLQTTRITRLDLTYPASILDLVATHFACLQMVFLHMTYKQPRADTCVALADPLRVFLDMISRVGRSYRPPAPNWRDQRIMVCADPKHATTVPRIPFPVKEIVHKIVYSDEEARYRLEVDNIATELFNEGWDLHCDG